MVEATVPRTRPQESIAPIEDKPDRASVPVDLRLRPALLAIWIAFVLGAVVFVLFGTVKIGAGHWIHRRLEVREIWSRFPAYLATQGLTQSIITLIFVTLVLICLGSALLLWLALALRNESVEVPARDESSAARE